jgi:hypothetical protein
MGNPRTGRVGAGAESICGLDRSVAAEDGMSIGLVLKVVAQVRRPAAGCVNGQAGQFARRPQEFERQAGGQDADDPAEQGDAESPGNAVRYRQRADRLPPASPRSARGRGHWG